jgi:glycosyltransferase domain-containing protein
MISLLIPTINRSEFIIRYLDYLNFANFKGEVLIGDSSNEEHFNITKHFIISNHFDFKIIHNSYPNKFHFEVIRFLIPFIGEKYCMYICDDDILVVNTLNKCINILESNPDYSGVGGLAIKCNIDLSIETNSFKILSTTKYNLTNIIYETALARFREICRNYTVVAYSLARTEQFLERWPINDNFNDKALAIELIPTFTAAVQGKVIFLEDLFVVRQIHEKRILLPNIFDAFLGNFWKDSCLFSINYITSLIKKFDKLQNENLHDEIKFLFSFYYFKSVILKYNKIIFIKISFRNKFIKKLKSNKFLFFYARKLKFFYTNHIYQNKYTFECMNNPKSKYYKDFNPIVNIIQKKY